MEDTSDPIGALEAFNKDLIKAINKVGEVYSLLSTVDDDGNVLHLDNKEQNLSKVFGAAYDNHSQSIKFNSFMLPLHQEFNKQNIKAEIIRSVIDTIRDNCQCLCFLLKPTNAVV